MGQLDFPLDWFRLEAFGSGVQAHLLPADIGSHWVLYSNKGPEFALIGPAYIT